jgi:hypothetical protein
LGCCHDALARGYDWNVEATILAVAIFELIAARASLGIQVVSALDAAVTVADPDAVANVIGAMHTQPSCRLSPQA